MHSNHIAKTFNFLQILSIILPVAKKCFNRVILLDVCDRESVRYHQQPSKNGDPHEENQNRVTHIRVTNFNFLS